jgi:hypothetical protein
MKKLILKDFIKKETDWLWSLINDKEWREDMWIAKGSVNKNMLYKQFWTTQKIIIEHLENCYWSETSLYADCVKDMIHDKKALREVAKHISIELKD